MMTKKGSGTHINARTRRNPLTGQTESVNGTKAGRKRFRLSWGDPLRTHDLPESKRRKKPIQEDEK
jgi:hypothetical protein